LGVVARSQTLPDGPQTPSAHFETATELGIPSPVIRLIIPDPAQRHIGRFRGADIAIFTHQLAGHVLRAVVHDKEATDRV
jgi:hypothetical protein